MRWRLCKLFQIPVDDEKFKTINDVQYVWYQMQDGLDKKEKFELLREVAEHNAMFWNPEGVDQVRNARENTFETNEADFENNLKEMFGREMPKQEKDEVSAENIISENPYLDMDLDEISFIPIGSD